MKIDGGCHCGQITFEAEVDPDGVAICNCTDCQVLSGTAFRIVVFAPAETFRILSGSPKIYTKIGESGNPRVQSFCENCGSPIYSCTVEEQPEFYNIRTGIVRQRAELKPTMQIWHRSALPWLGEIDDIPAKEREEGGITPPPSPQR